MKAVAARTRPAPAGAQRKETAVTFLQAAVAYYAKHDAAAALSCIMRVNVRMERVMTDNTDRATGQKLSGWPAPV
jgi:hypothetical protein